MMTHTATHCNSLQHTATHRNTLQHTATHCNTLQQVYHSLKPGQIGSMDEDDYVYNIIFELGATALHHLTTLLVVIMCCAPVL